MDNHTEIKTTAAESFTCLYNFLDKTGQSGFLIKPKTKFLNFCYQVYRLLVGVIIFFFTLHHIIFIVLVILVVILSCSVSEVKLMLRELNSASLRVGLLMNQKAWGDMDKVLEGVSFTIPTVNGFVKYIVLNLATSRLRKIFTLLNGPIFDANNENDAKLLEENKKFIQNLHRKCLYLITVTVSSRFVVFILNKIQDDNAIITSYFPFEIKSWNGYMLAVFIETLPCIWAGHGHISLDILVVTYYAQARTQLKIIRSNLENLCADQRQTSDHDQSSEEVGVRIGVNQYVDDLDENVHERFVTCVERYDKVVWYTNEVTDIFCKSILFQFFSIAMPICFMVIKLSIISIGSMEFLFLGILILVQMMQVFLYCIFGGLVIDESNLITQSLYLGQWESLTPRFRRQILIAGECWRSPIEPRIAYIIPLSLDTFISIAKSVYTLFTLLKTMNVNIE